MVKDNVNVTVCPFVLIGCWGCSRKVLIKINSVNSWSDFQFHLCVEVRKFAFTRAERTSLQCTEIIFGCVE